MRVLITGASRGIGRALARRLADDGRFPELHLALGGASHPEALNALGEELRPKVDNVIPVVGDLADPTTPERLINEVLSALGGLDAIVSNAGIGKPHSLLDATLEQWDRVLNINLRATWLLAKAAYPALRESEGHIITVSSLSGVAPQPDMGAYSVAKSGLIMLTRLMAQEWAADRIRANCVSPGFVVTEMTQAAYADDAFRRAREAHVPVGRLADPGDDIAGVVAFLLSDDARYCNGQNFVVDGGVTDSILRVLPRRSQ
ncbi:MAG: SDR family oxidoreductase [Pseudomonadota bacterium]